MIKYFLAIAISISFSLNAIIVDFFILKNPKTGKLVYLLSDIHIENKEQAENQASAIDQIIKANPNAKLMVDSYMATHIPTYNADTDQCIISYNASNLKDQTIGIIHNYIVNNRYPNEIESDARFASYKNINLLNDLIKNINFIEKYAKSEYLNKLFLNYLRYYILQLKATINRQQSFNEHIQESVLEHNNRRSDYASDLFDSQILYDALKSDKDIIVIAGVKHIELINSVLTSQSLPFQFKTIYKARRKAPSSVRLLEKIKANRSINLCRDIKNTYDIFKENSKILSYDDIIAPVKNKFKAA